VVLRDDAWRRGNSDAETRICEAFEQVQSD
jgi:hypothetical protein